MKPNYMVESQYDPQRYNWNGVTPDFPRKTVTTVPAQRFLRFFEPISWFRLRHSTLWLCGTSATAAPPLDHGPLAAHPTCPVRVARPDRFIIYRNPVVPG